MSAESEANQDHVYTYSSTTCSNTGEWLSRPHVQPVLSDHKPHLIKCIPLIERDVINTRWVGKREASCVIGKLSWNRLLLS